MLLRIRHVYTKVAERVKTHVLYSITSFSPKIVPLMRTAYPKTRHNISEELNLLTSVRVLN